MVWLKLKQHETEWTCHKHAGWPMRALQNSLRKAASGLLFGIKREQQTALTCLLPALAARVEHLNLGQQLRTLFAHELACVETWARSPADAGCLHPVAPVCWPCWSAWPSPALEHQQILPRACTGVGSNLVEPAVVSLKCNLTRHQPLRGADRRQGHLRSVLIKRR